MAGNTTVVVKAGIVMLETPRWRRAATRWSSRGRGRNCYTPSQFLGPQVSCALYFLAFFFVRPSAIGFFLARLSTIHVQTGPARYVAHGPARLSTGQARLGTQAAVPMPAQPGARAVLGQAAWHAVVARARPG
jgi:hypothetical protein